LSGVITIAVRSATLRVRGVAASPSARASSQAFAMSMLLYVVHLAVILWWLLDKSPKQRATTRLVAMLAGGLPVASLALRLDPARALLRAADVIARQSLFGERS
jgi:hypothetical protein